LQGPKSQDSGGIILVAESRANCSSYFNGLPRLVLRILVLNPKNCLLNVLFPYGGHFNYTSYFLKHWFNKL